MKTAPPMVDVVVVGGGPAGAAAALKAARLGHEVCLIDRGSGSWHGGFAQSLAPSVLPLLDALGVSEDIEAARFSHSAGVLLLWGEGQPRYRAFEHRQGLQIERGLFDSILRNAAMRAGAIVLCPANVHAVERTPEETTAWRVRLTIGSERLEIRTRILVDAAGRKLSPPAARARTSPPLICVLGRWRASRNVASGSVVEAGADCWYWAGRQRNGTLTAAVFFDPRSRLLAGRVSLATAYCALIANSRLLRDVGGDLLAPVIACDATSRHVHDPLEENLVRVGEAAVSLDPLSSQGIQAALTAGLQAAIVVNTWLRRPRRAAAADAFYRDRHADVIRRGESNRRQIYAEAAQRLGTAFWNERSAPPVQADTARAARRATPVPDPFARLQLAKGVRVRPAAIVRNDLAEFAPAVVGTDSEQAVAFLGDVPIGELAARLVAGAPAAELVRSWSETVGEARALRALAWMWQRGLVEADKTVQAAVPPPDHSVHRADLADALSGTA
jgi:flavin-dependent dehydrogenase